MRRARRWSLTLVGIAMAAFVVQSMASASAPREYEWELPKGLPKPNVPSNNPMSDAKVAVGRRLFYDVRLSGNGTQSCGSCHRQELAFTDGKAVAVGSTNWMIGPGTKPNTSSTPINGISTERSRTSRSLVKCFAVSSVTGPVMVRWYIRRP